MSLRRSTPLTFNPRGLSDTLDGSTAFSGAMNSLQNLIPDPSTRNLWQCRPAANKLADFATSGGAFSSGFSPGFQITGFAAVATISCMKVFGNIAFGMVKLGADPTETPFAFNLLTNLFMTVSGSGSNQPTATSPSGAWVPPTMDVVGTKVIVTHPGFTGAGGVFFGWFDITNPAAITWNGGNIAGTPFTSPPTFVANFNQRAYYIAIAPSGPGAGQPSVVFTNVLDPLSNVGITAPILTFGDAIPLTALGPLPLSNQLGGIIQALVVFKGSTNMYQITGDAANVPPDLKINSLNVATGTLSPLSLASTPKGLAFISPDGLRFVDYNAHISDPVGLDGDGKVLPFIYSLVPSRVVAAANGSLYRVTVQDASIIGSPFVEYWFDTGRQTWSGPHTFPCRAIDSYQNTFILASHNAASAIWQSDYFQNPTSSFVENGQPLTFTWTTCLLPDTNQMSENAMIETTIYMALNPGDNYTVQAFDQNGATLNTAIVANPNPAVLWGQFTWGHALWGGTTNNLFPRPIPWPKPVVFRRTALSAAGLSSALVRVGTLHLRYEQLGYLSQGQAA